MEFRAIVTREVVNIKKEISFHDVYVHYCLGLDLQPDAEHKEQSV